MIFKRAILFVIIGVILIAGVAYGKDDPAVLYSGTYSKELNVPTGSQVYYPSGTYYFTEMDLRVSARSIPMTWERTYRSNRVLKKNTQWVFGEPADGPLGFGWTSPWFIRIEGDAFINEQGRYFYFQKDSVGNYLPNMEAGYVLRKTATGYELIETGSNTYTFDTTGKLTSIKDTRGNTATQTYNTDNRLTSIKDIMGRTIFTFTHNSGGRISSVTDIAGRTINYEYDTTGNLIKVSTTQNSQSITLSTYTYNANHGITTKSNPLNETYTIEYYPVWVDKGIAKRVIDPVGTEMLKQGQQPVGHEMTFTYDFPNRVFYYTDYRGITYKSIMNDKGQILSIDEVQNNQTTPVTKTEYLENRTTKTTDALGNITITQKDEWGNIIKKIDPEGNEWKYTYSQSKLLSITDTLGIITKYEYDTYGNRTKITQAEGKTEQTIASYVYDNYNQMTSVTTGGATKTINYNTAGLPTTITDALNNTTTIQYDAYGNATAIIDPNNNKTEFTYDMNGNRLTAKDPLDNITTYTYNAADRPTTIKDALNRVANINTDFKGRITAITDVMNNKKEYQYDGSGNVIKVTEGATITTRTYDSSNRLTSITDSEGNKTTYEYAAGTTCSSCTGGSIGSPIKMIDPLGNITKYIYDKNGKLSSAIDLLGNISLLSRDATGKVTTRIDPNGKITKYQYDALGRIIKQTDANNGEITFTYDTKGNLKTLSDPEGNTTTFEYDFADRKIKETRPMGQAIEYAYYPNGLLKTIKDSKGQITAYSYDSANRFKEITYADGKKDTFTYDEVGNMLTYKKDGVSGTISYDNLNRKLSETVNYGSFSKTSSYSYDALSNKATFTSPEGNVYTYTYNKNNQPTGIAFDNKTIGLTYQVDRLTKAILPNGVTTDYQYNANSWLNYINTKNATSTISDRQYGFDNVGNILSKNTEHGNYSYNYDPTYQLTSAANPVLPQETFTYDKVGNRLTSASLRAEGEAISSYTHNANNELSQSCIVNPASCIVYVYDENGNTIQETNGGNVTKFIYNTGDRLEKVELPDGRIATYTYDPFGRRIKKDVAGDVTYYLYADEGLIGEYDSIGNLKKAYGWIPDSTWGTNPIFMLENNNYYFYHNDHLGTPQKITDVNSKVVWSATYTAFGEAVVDSSSTIANNLRLPGQYYDAETGKHYNWNRYYDPQRGTYTQVDPIGFEAGDENLYRYVAGNPIRWADPLGLVEYDPKRINCIGYACGSGQYVQPSPGESIKAFLQNLGYQCKKVTKSSNCKCECNQDKMMVYIYTYETNPNKKDPYSDPWIFGPGNDIHAIREDKPGSWSYVPHAMPQPGEITKGLKNPDEYWKGKTIPHAYCCCKTKK